MKVADVLDAQPLTATPDEPASAAWERMQKGSADYLVVLAQGHVVGTLARHDLGGPQGGARRRMGRRVGELMRREVFTASPQASVRAAAAQMRTRSLGCLPVVRAGRLVGLVTVARLLELLEKTLAAGTASRRAALTRPATHRRAPRSVTHATT